MKRIIVFCVLASVLGACNKDKFKTQPQVTINSFNPSEANVGAIVSLNATIRDKEGDLQDSLLVVRKRYSGDNLLTADTIRYSLADYNFPDKSKIELQLLFDYGQIVPGTILINQEQVDRNFAIGIIIRDRAGNKSDYVESAKIVLKKI
jgi:hypothetical protein